MKVDVLAHQGDQTPVLFGKQVLASFYNSFFEQGFVLPHVNRRLEVLANQHQEEIAVLVNVDSVICDHVMERVEKVVKHDRQLFVDDPGAVVVGVVFVLVVVVLDQQFTEDAVQLGLGHWAKVKVDKHVFIEDVCVFFEDLDLLDKAVVDDYHGEAARFKMDLVDGEFFQNLFLPFDLEQRLYVV